VKSSGASAHYRDTEGLGKHQIRVVPSVLYTALANKSKLFPTNIIILQIKSLEVSSVRTRFNAVLKFHTLPEPRTELVVRFCTTTEPWTELRSGSEKFRFELWFRTELRHPYN